MRTLLIGALAATLIGRKRLLPLLRSSTFFVCQLRPAPRAALLP
jgi:hypothetical protein